MWLKPQGYASISSPETARITLDNFQCDEIKVGVTEYDTSTCFHCNRVTHIKPRMDPAEMGGLCKICMKLICRYCVGEPCVPFEKKIEAMEKREIARRSYGG